MKAYNIVFGEKVIGVLQCDGLLFDIEHQNEHVIPYADVQAVRIVLGDGVSLKEITTSWEFKSSP